MPNLDPRRAKLLLLVPLLLLRVYRKPPLRIELALEVVMEWLTLSREYQ